MLLLMSLMLWLSTAFGGVNNYSLRPILFAWYSILGCPKLFVLFEKSMKKVYKFPQINLHNWLMQL